VLYNEIIDTTDELSNEEAGKLFKMILAKVNGREIEIEDRTLRLVFKPIEKQLIRDLNKYENTLVERSQSGRSGNLKKHYPDLYKEFKKGKISIDEAFEIGKARKTSHSEKSIANVAVNVNVNDPVPENGIVNENDGVDDDKTLDVTDAANFILKNNPLVVQAFISDFKLKDKKQLISIMKDFHSHLYKDNISKKTPKDYRKHLSSWYRKREEGKKENKKVGGYSSEDVDRIYKSGKKF